MTFLVASKHALPYPSDCNPSNVPAFVREFPDERLAVLSHPSNDRFHSTIRAAIARYSERGWAHVFTEFSGFSRGAA